MRSALGGRLPRAGVLLQRPLLMRMAILQVQNSAAPWPVRGLYD